MIIIRKTSGRAFVLGLFLSLASLSAMAIDIDAAYARGESGGEGEGGGTGGGGGAGGAGGAGDAGDDQSYDNDYNSPRPSLAALRKKRDKDREAQGLSIIGKPGYEPHPPIYYRPIQVPAIQEVLVRIEDTCFSRTPQETTARGIEGEWCDEFWPKARRILVAYDGSKEAQDVDIVELMRELQERLAAHAEN